MDIIQEPWFKFILDTAILSLTGIIAMTTILLRKKIGEAIISFVQNKFNLKIYSCDNHIDKDEVEKDKTINYILAELRLQTRADRAKVFQFHNGTMFTSKNQMWKLSCTHEIVETVKSSQGDLQSILSSSVSQLIYPLWDSSDLSYYKGIDRISPECCNCSNIEQCVLPKGVYFYTVENIQQGFSKGLLLSHSVKYILKCPLIDSQDNLIGFVCLDYCWDETNVAEIKSCSELLCITATRISYELTKKQS